MRRPETAHHVLYKGACAGIRLVAAIGGALEDASGSG